MTIGAAEVARKIDHTLLKPEATGEQVDKLCDEAVEHGFHSICVNPVFIQRVVKRLDAARLASTKRPAVNAVAGFPLGASLTSTKADEAARAMDQGATEVDMVVAIGALIGGDQRYVRQDVEALAHVVHRVKGGILKVILETGALTNDQIILGCRCSGEGEADFVKTSTGFHTGGGATVEHVRLLHKHASPLKVKASGGIRTAAQALAMIEAGAARLGTSSGIAILHELREAATAR